MEIKACALGTWESKKQWEASSGQRDSRGTEHRDQDGHGWGRAAQDLGSVPSFSVSSLCLVPVEDCRMWSTALLHQHMLCPCVPRSTCGVVLPLIARGNVFMCLKSFHFFSSPISGNSGLTSSVLLLGCGSGRVEVAVPGCC